jgi:hypothetical protein
MGVNGGSDTNKPPGPNSRAEQTAQAEQSLQADRIARENREASSQFTRPGSYRATAPDPTQTDPSQLDPDAEAIADDRPPTTLRGAFIQSLRGLGAVIATLIVVAGLLILAAAILAPAEARNRALEQEHTRLQAEIDHVEEQIEINRDFLTRLPTDPQLLERLRLRQGHPAPPGTSELELDPKTDHAIQSPLAITRLAPPDPDALPQVRPLHPLLLWTLDPKTRWIGICAGLLLVAIGLIAPLPTRRLKQPS